MNGIQAFCVLGSRLALAWVLTWVLKSLIKIFLPLDIPNLVVFVLCLAYTFQIDASDRKPIKSEKKPPKLEKIPPKSDEKLLESDTKALNPDTKPAEAGKEPLESDKKLPKSVPQSIHNRETSKSIPEFVKEEADNNLTTVKQLLNTLEKLLKAHGELIQGSGFICVEALRQIYKDHKDRLRQYNDFREQRVDQPDPTVQVLESQRRDIIETPGVATEQNTFFCNLIWQYREAVEDNHKYIQQHVDSVSKTLEAQEIVLTQTREILDERDKSNKDILLSQRNLIEHNQRLIREHGTLIDSVVSDHANLVTEYQKELDSLLSLTTANRIFTLMHATPSWESLGDWPQRIGAGRSDACGTQDLPKAHKKLIKQPHLGKASANVVENVQQIARTFRNTSQDAIKDTQRTPAVAGRQALLPGRGNNAAEAEHSDWKLGTSSGMDQMMPTVLGQPDGTPHTTATVRHAEITEQLGHAQEDMEKLRADIGAIQEVQRVMREDIEKGEKLRKSRLEVEAFRDKLAQQDSGRQTQCAEVFRWVVNQEPADEGNAASATTTTAATGSTGFTDGDTVIAATITEPADVTHPGLVPTAMPTKNDDASALDVLDAEGGGAVLDDNDWEDIAGDDREGRLLDDVRGRTLTRAADRARRSRVARWAR